ncbi:MAG: 30S ribosomal protein S3, partial [Rhodothermaceae bacterium]|nr:30S ribosomal protein S3 [Rhodothermaceae bacterium]
VIGRGGQEVEKLREELKRVTTKDIQININEIKRPELDASLVAQNVAQQLEGRVSFRRAMKQALQGAMRMGAQGIRIKVGGRLGGAEMGRVEQYLEGRVPLHTIRADIDYAEATAFTIYGTTGVKVWVYHGEILGRPDLSPNVQAQRQQLRQMHAGGRGSESKARDRRRGKRDGRRRRTGAGDVRRGGGRG